MVTQPAETVSLPSFYGRLDYRCHRALHIWGRLLVFQMPFFPVLQYSWFHIIIIDRNVGDFLAICISRGVTSLGCGMQTSAHEMGG